MKHINRFAILIKRLIILGVPIAIVLFLYSTFLPDIFERTNLVIGIILAWFLTAYLALPQVHRLLTRFYVPNNFIGRARTADGLLADPTNLALVGNKRELISAMEQAGWVQADPMIPKYMWRSAKAFIFRQSYPTAPVSTFFLFGKPQDLAFQMEVGGNTHKRHHVRFWRTPRNWYLPGGHKVDWIGQASFDDAVRFSLLTLQFTHKIDANVDKERDFLIDSLRDAGRLKTSRRIEHFFSGYSTRNGDGYHYITDGSMVIAELKAK